MRRSPLVGLDRSGRSRARADPAHPEGRRSACTIATRTRSAFGPRVADRVRLLPRPAHRLRLVAADRPVPDVERAWSDVADAVDDGSAAGVAWFASCPPVGAHLAPVAALEQRVTGGVGARRHDHLPRIAPDIFRELPAGILGRELLGLSRSVNRCQQLGLGAEPLGAPDPQVTPACVPHGLDPAVTRDDAKDLGCLHPVLPITPAEALHAGQRVVQRGRRALSVCRATCLRSARMRSGPRVPRGRRPCPGP